MKLPSGLGNYRRVGDRTRIGVALQSRGFEGYFVAR